MKLFKQEIWILSAATLIYLALLYLNTLTHTQGLNLLREEFDRIEGADNEGILGERLRLLDKHLQHASAYISLVFPFLGNNTLIHKTPGKYQGKGIVICVGDTTETNIYLALSSLMSIQTVLASTLPIELFYLGADDLSIGSQELLLAKLSNLKLLNLLNIYPNLKDLGNVKGFNMKPFALLASSFHHAVLMDADAVFLRDPREIFETRAYLNTGTAFFHDRWIRTRQKDANNRQKQFLKGIIGKNISKYSLRILQPEFCNHEQESGVVGYDKKRHFTSLLSACSIIATTNSNEAGYGDKEMYWLGAAVLGKEFQFVDQEYGAGVLGQEKSKSHICGPHILHVGEDMKPFWFNGGILAEKSNGLSKTRKLTPTGNFTSWIVASMDDAEWKGGRCLHAEEKAKEFSERELFVLNETRVIFQSLL